MERTLVLCGIGGQGVQLAAQVIARAALRDGRAVQMFGSYGGMMRGGNTEATLVVADDVIESPPTISATWSAILMHHEHSAATVARVTDGSISVLNTSVITEPLALAGTIIPLPATDIATDLGNPLAAAMVATGAFARATGLVGLDALESAVPDAVPSYRSQHVEINVRALAAGYDCVERAVDAWDGPC